MFRRGFIVFRIFMAVLVIGALVAGGFMLFRAGQAQGYALGLAAASSGSALQPAAPLMPVYPGYYYPHFFFFPFGWIFGLLFLGFLFFGLVGRAFRFHAWRAGGPHDYPPHWMKDWRADPSQAKEPETPTESK